MGQRVPERRAAVSEMIAAGAGAVVVVVVVAVAAVAVVAAGVHALFSRVVAVCDSCSCHQSGETVVSRIAETGRDPAESKRCHGLVAGEQVMRRLLSDCLDEARSADCCVGGR